MCTCVSTDKAGVLELVACGFTGYRYILKKTLSLTLITFSSQTKINLQGGSHR